MTPVDDDARLAEVVAAVLASRRYRNVDPNTVRRIAAMALQRSGKVAEAVKRSKRSLHQIYSAYLPRQPDYAALLRELSAARERGQGAIRDALRPALSRHASTAEREPHLQAFYRALHDRVGTVDRVLDVACGLQPLTWAGWSESPPQHIEAFDIDHAMMGFVDQGLELLGAAHDCRVADLTEPLPRRRVDVALVLKTLPCLEQQVAGRSRTMLREIDARWVVVSFPTRSLGGRATGMYATYSTQFEKTLGDLGWSGEAAELGPELVYFVRPG